MNKSKRLCINYLFVIMTAIACGYFGAFVAVKFGMEVYDSSADYVAGYFAVHPILISTIYAGTAIIYCTILRTISASQSFEMFVFALGLFFFTWLHAHTMLNKYSFAVLHLELCVNNFLFQSFTVPKAMIAAPELFMLAVFLLYLCVPVFIYNMCNLFLTFKSDDYMPKTKPILGMLISAGIWIMLKFHLFR